MHRAVWFVASHGSGSYPLITSVRLIDSQQLARFIVCLNWIDKGLLDFNRRLIRVFYGFKT